MGIPTVKEIMVPLEQYATVFEDATLVEAIRTLEEAQRAFNKDSYRHRAVLVLNRDGRLVGKLSQHDVIKALEPKYRSVSGLGSVSRFGWSQQYLESIAREHGLWTTPLEGLCRLSASLRVKEVMHTPEAGEYLDQDAPITRALHHLVMGSHDSLLVMNKRQEIVGVLRLTDLFCLICKTMKGCPEDKGTE